jgi:RNA polymerase sigma factor (TIGR02999 family)
MATQELPTLDSPPKFDDAELAITASHDEHGALTQLIREADDGDLSAREQLIRALYPRLRSIARYRLSAGAPMTLLDPTALLHESLAKLLDRGFAGIQNSAHLVSYAATTMRSVLVDYARERNAQKRDGGERVSLTYLDLEESDQSLDLLALDAAMAQLSAVDPRLTLIVELRCFAGLKIEEIAEQLAVSERTVARDWQKARAFIMMFLREEGL